MTVVTAPLLSVAASGTIKKSITFTTNKGRAVVKGNRLIEWNGYWFKIKKVFSESIKQKAIRGTFKQGVCNWNDKTAEQKKVYKDEAKGKATTGVALYLKEHIEETYNENLFRVYWLLGYGPGFPLHLFTCGNIEQYMYSKLRRR